MWCRPPVPRPARARDAWLCHVSSVGGARRRGCAAAGAPGFFNGPLGGEASSLCGDQRLPQAAAEGVAPAETEDERERATRADVGQVDPHVELDARGGDREDEAGP